MLLILANLRLLSLEFINIIEIKKLKQIDTYISINKVSIIEKALLVRSKNIY